MLEIICERYELPPDFNPNDDLKDFRLLYRQLTKRSFTMDSARLRRVAKSVHWLVARDTSRLEENQRGKIIASAVLVPVETPLEHFGFIEDVVVDGNYRRKGLGQKLVMMLIARAKELKLSCLELTTRPARQAANEMYLKLGFKSCETNYYRLILE